MVSRRRLLKHSKLSRKKNRIHYRKKSNKKMKRTKRTKRTRNQRRLVKGGGGGTKRVTFAQKDVDYKKKPMRSWKYPDFQQTRVRVHFLFGELSAKKIISVRLRTQITPI